MKKKITIAVTSDLVTDQRVHKVALTLHHAGYEVVLIGRQKKKQPKNITKNISNLTFQTFF